MNWQVALPLLASLVIGAITVGGSVIVARQGNAEKRKDRQSSEIRFLVDELQEELKTAKQEIKDLRLELKVLRAEMLIEQQRGDQLQRENAQFRERQDIQERRR